MRIGEIEKQKCGNCPLIEMCGDSYENPCLCCVNRLKNVEISDYQKSFDKTDGKDVAEMAEELGLELHAPENLSDEEKEIYEEENGLLNNYKQAFMELFIKNRNKSFIGRKVLVPGKYNTEIICTVVKVNDEDDILFLKDEWGNKYEFELSEIKFLTE